MYWTLARGVPTLAVLPQTGLSPGPACQRMLLISCLAHRVTARIHRLAGIPTVLTPDGTLRRHLANANSRWRAVESGT